MTLDKKTVDQIATKWRRCKEDIYEGGTKITMNGAIKFEKWLNNLVDKTKK